MVEIYESDSTWLLKLKDESNVNNKDNIITEVEDDDDRTIKVAIGDGKLSIISVEYPKSIYDGQDIIKVAKRIETEGSNCPSCKILSAVRSTRKNFIIPTMKDILNI